MLILTLRNLLCHIIISQKYKIMCDNYVVVDTTSDLEQFCEDGTPYKNEAIQRNLDTRVLSFASIDDVLVIVVDLWED